jgi:hypothetical protein
VLQIPFFGRPCCFLVRPDRRAVEEGHAQRNAALLGEVEQLLPHTETSPADKHLRRPPPRPKVGRHTAPLGSVLVPPNDRLDRPAQVMGRCLPARTACLNERLKNRPLIIRQNDKSVSINHARYIGAIIKR